MNFKLATILDVYLGKILLQFVSIFPPFPKEIVKDGSYENILVIKFWGIGTILETTPLFRALKQKYPGIPIDVLTFADNKRMAESLGLFKNIYSIDLNGGYLNLFWQIIRFIFAYRHRYSLIMDLEFFAAFSALVTKILASKYSLGFESFINSRNRCYSRTVIFDHSNHVRVIFTKFLNALYIERCQSLILSVPNISEDKKKSVIEKFPALKDNCIKIGININSSELCVNRRWPEENFKKLIAFMQRDYSNLRIYLSGGQRDLHVVRSFYESLPDKKGISIMAGNLDILEFSYALSNLSFLITNDSGPVHIAESIGVPVVSFFGPETPRLYGPVSDRSLVFYKDIYCSPCLNVYNHKRSTCKDNQCLKLILPEDVYEQIKTKFLC